jgi:hypothetical protein
MGERNRAWILELENSKYYNENSIYVFPEMELRGLSPNFPTHVYVSDL